MRNFIIETVLREWKNQNSPEEEVIEHKIELILPSNFYRIEQGINGGYWVTCIVNKDEVYKIDEQQYKRLRSCLMR